MLKDYWQSVAVIIPASIVIVHAALFAPIRFTICERPGLLFGETYDHLIVPFTVRVAADVSFVFIPTPLNALIKKVFSVVVDQ